MSTASASIASARDANAWYQPASALCWLLRISCACEFVGHGAFGIMTKRAWLPYFGVAGIHEHLAYTLMPIVGTIDISLGFLAILRPMRLTILYMAVWGLWTALLRPLSGESPWETVERAPNYLVPLSLLVVMGLPWSWTSLIADPVPPRARIAPMLSAQAPPRYPSLSAAQRTLLAWCLRLATAGAFIGHGAYGLRLHKPGWYPFFLQLGQSHEAVQAHHLIDSFGATEMLLGVLVLVYPFAGLLILLMAFKLATEIVWYPLNGSPWWEVLERTSNYLTPLALLVVLRMRPAGPASASSRALESPLGQTVTG